jgi:putative membrane protein insertion efficiency factor
MCDPSPTPHNTPAPRTFWQRCAAMLVLWPVRAYQLLISPLIGPKCRHMPSCSHYTIEAVARFGAVRGAWLGLRRILRCHPFGTAGFDPVPTHWPGFFVRHTHGLGRPQAPAANTATPQHGKPESACACPDGATTPPKKP